MGFFPFSLVDSPVPLLSPSGSIFLSTPSPATLPALTYTLTSAVNVADGRTELSRAFSDNLNVRSFAFSYASSRRHSSHRFVVLRLRLDLSFSLPESHSSILEPAAQGEGSIMAGSSRELKRTPLTPLWRFAKTLRRPQIFHRHPSCCHRCQLLTQTLTALHHSWYRAY